MNAGVSVAPVTDSSSGNPGEGKVFYRPADLIEVTGFIIILCGLYVLSSINYTLFHSIVEGAGIVVVFSIFVIIWNTREIHTDGFFLIIGISFLFFGFIDLIHTLAFKSMGIFPGDSANLPTQLWISARYFQSITFLIATLFIGRSITKDGKFDLEVVVSACSVLCLFLLSGIFIWPVFPECYIDGNGLTLFKVLSEYLISLIFIATIIIIYLKREYFDPIVWKLLIGAQTFLILGELSFTSYINVFGFMNMLGHLFRLISIYLFYRVFVVVGITQPYDLLLRNLKQKEKALRESMEQFRTVFDQTNHMMAILDSQGNLVKMNTIGIRYLKGELIDPESVLGKPFWLTYCWAHNPVQQERMKQAVPRALSGEVIRFETTHPSVSGLLEIDFSLKPVKDDNGHVCLLIAEGWDITARKKAEKALELANRKMNLLSGITRHDINNQLTTLKGYLDLVRETPCQEKQNSDYISKIEQSAEAIEHQIQFTKEYEDMGVNSPSWQKIEDCIKDALTLLPMRDISVYQDCSHYEIYADPLLRKVFYNLIDNALRYGGEDMSVIRFSCRESDDGLTLAVEDDGVGIPYSEKEKLFERGFGKHTGLGLFLSREILSITGIGIKEDGKDGKGARFEIFIPKGVFR